MSKIKFFLISAIIGLSTSAFANDATTYSCYYNDGQSIAFSFSVSYSEDGTSLTIQGSQAVSCFLIPNSYAVNVYCSNVAPQDQRYDDWFVSISAQGNTASYWQWIKDGKPLSTVPLSCSSGNIF